MNLFPSINKFKIVLVYQPHICISQSSHFYICWWTQNVNRWGLLCFVSPSYASSLGWFCNRAALVHPAVPDVELGGNECAYWLLVFGARLICVYCMWNDDQNLKLILHNDVCQMNIELGLERATILYIQHFNTYWCCQFSHLDWLISQCIPRTIFNE